MTRKQVGHQEEVMESEKGDKGDEVEGKNGDGNGKIKVMMDLREEDENEDDIMDEEEAVKSEPE